MAVLEAARLDGADDARQRPVLTLEQATQVVGKRRAQVLLGALGHVGDHAVEAHALAVLWRVDASNAIGVQLVDLLAHDHSPAAAKDADMTGAALVQQVDHVFEIFDMPALIGAHRDGVGVLLDGGGDDVVDRAVVAEVDHLRTVRL